MLLTFIPIIKLPFEVILEVFETERFRVDPRALEALSGLGISLADFL